MVVATLFALLALAATAGAVKYIGGTTQPGPRMVHVITGEHDHVTQASVSWIAKCGGGGSLRSRTTVTDFSRASARAFAKHFRGREKVGGRKMKLRYSFVGKLKRPNFFGTLRLSARYRPKHGSKRVTCRTGLVRWIAHPPRDNR
jgi:hypothetical protein